MKPREAIHNGKRVQVVQWTENGKRRKKFFSSKAAARIWIAERQAAEENLGREIAAAADPEFIAEAVALSRKVAEHGGTLSDAVTEYIRLKELHGHHLTMEKLRNDFIDDREKDRDLAPLTLKELKARSKVVVDKLGAQTVAATVTPEHIRSLLNGMSHGPQTVNHYRRIAFGLFAYGATYKGLQSNPVEAIPKRKVIRKTPGILTPEQIATALSVAAGDSELLCWISLGAFAGVRSAEIERLDWSNINLESGSITLLPSVTKARRKRTVTIRPRLKNILSDLQQIGGPVVRHDFNTCKKFAAFKAGLPFRWPHNALRHSFGTYHYRAFRHAGETAIQMGHRGSPTMLLEHYDNENVTQAEALRFWQEEPSEVAKEVAR